MDIANWLGSRPGSVALFVRSTGRTFLINLCHAFETDISSQLKWNWGGKQKGESLRSRPSQTVNVAEE